MLLNGTKYASRFACRHAAFFANADRIEQYDEFTTIAENVNVRPVPALVAQVHIGIEAVDFALRHDSIIPNQVGFVTKSI